jgi:hypothetical protein
MSEALRDPMRQRDRRRAFDERGCGISRWGQGGCTVPQVAGDARGTVPEVKRSDLGLASRWPQTSEDALHTNRCIQQYGLLAWDGPMSERWGRNRCDGSTGWTVLGRGIRGWGSLLLSRPRPTGGGLNVGSHRTRVRSVSQTRYGSARSVTLLKGAVLRRSGTTPDRMPSPGTEEPPLVSRCA